MTPPRLRLLICAGLAVAAVCALPPVRAAKGDNPDKTEKPEKPDKTDKPEKPDKPAKPERTDSAPRSERTSKSERSDKGTKAERKASAGAAGAPAASAAATGSAAAAAARPNDFERFRPVVDRNIFNPNRTPRTRATDEAPPPRTDTFALVGTMETDQGVVAIFDGSGEAYRAAVPVEGEIAGFKVAKISPNAVELAADGKAQTVRMSQQMRRTEGGEWRLSGRDMSRTEFARPENATDKARAAGTAEVPANASDVVRRLMEQRQKQLKQ